MNWYFKASLSCYFPSYLVDSKEVLRAIPAHLLGGNQSIRGRDSGSNLAPRDRLARTQTYIPRTPSPLRQAMVSDRPVKDNSFGESHEGLKSLESISLLFVTKRGTSTPHRPKTVIAFGIMARSRLRKTAYSFVFVEEGPVQTDRSCCEPIPSPTRLEAIERNTNAKVVRSRRSNYKPAVNEVAALRSGLSDARKQIKGLQRQLKRIDRMAERSVNVQTRAHQQQDRLSVVCKALIDAEKERLTETRLRFRRS
ncbi:uncharacterized protein FOMMEDRAFT_18865 [Fomitiporia mediterranea MF3/22]|uniref:uncharacterized protein n=1 Tax=Fomitiporia mediterranea (strain MF3/22) TaxID=694068 RepID=UPI00044099AE|nr:uncharacterized protein FOMMEDRAFT_18865 [Fomitiporia mediterranea MF3/22]EJD05259.1 hypothetical protein FOMMEDRAFT_18865 [Fomitiporia mediterranea MF3/22]